MQTNKSNLSIDLSLLVDDNELFLSEVAELLFQSLMELPIEAHMNIENWTKDRLIDTYHRMKNSAALFGVYPDPFSCIRFLFHNILDYDFMIRYVKTSHLIKFKEKFDNISHRIPPYKIKEDIPEAIRELRKHYNLYLVSENILVSPESIKQSLDNDNPYLDGISPYFNGFLFSSIIGVLKPDIRMFIVKNSNIDGPVIMQKHLDTQQYENEESDILPQFIKVESLEEYIETIKWTTKFINI